MPYNNDGFNPTICHTQNLNFVKFDYPAVKTIFLPFS